MTTTRFPVESVAAPASPLTDYSGFTTAGVSVEIMPALPTARLYRIQNLSDTLTLWINDTGGAAAPAQPGSYALLPGGYYEFPGVFAVSVYAAAVVPFSAGRF